MLPQQRNVRDCLYYTEVTLLTVQGPKDGEGADLGVKKGKL